MPYLNLQSLLPSDEDLLKTLEEHKPEYVCRNMPGLKSESGCSGVITFKYKDGSVIVVNRNSVKSNKQ